VIFKIQGKDQTLGDRWWRKRQCNSKDDRAALDPKDKNAQRS